MEGSMTPYAIAQTYIGTTEGPGPANNPVIIEMYSTVGHEWVEHDVVAWCAAYVGHCIERAGLRSTRKLNARSYLDWGVPVDLADAQEGDVVIFSRGDPSGWQGHVGFFVRTVGASIEVLGGNQADAVNVKRYSKAKLLGVRRAGNVAPAVTMGVRAVQTRLRALGYHEVGSIDGSIGPRTRAAILAFRDDNSAVAGSDYRRGAHRGAGQCPTPGRCAGARSRCPDRKPDCDRCQCTDRARGRGCCRDCRLANRARCRRGRKRPGIGRAGVWHP